MMKSIRVAVFIIPILLGGCAEQMAAEQQQRISESNLQRSKEFEACKKQPLTRKNAVSQMDCAISVNLKHDEEIHYPFMWISQQVAASSRQSAVEYSEGKISKEKFKTALMQHQAWAHKAHAEEVAKLRQAQEAERIRTQQIQREASRRTLEMINRQNQEDDMINCTTTGGGGTWNTNCMRW